MQSSMFSLWNTLFFFKALISCIVSYVHSICILIFHPSLSLNYFIFLLLLSLPLPFLFGDCFSLLPPNDFVPSHFMFSFILHPQGGTVPPPTSLRSILTELLTSRIPLRLIEAPALASCGHFQPRPGTQELGRAMGHHPPPLQSPPVAQIFLLEDICLSRVSPHQGRQLACPFPREKKKIISCLTHKIVLQCTNIFFHGTE